MDANIENEKYTHNNFSIYFILRKIKMRLPEKKQCVVYRKI